jgi:hypothetical protein
MVMAMVVIMAVVNQGPYRGKHSVLLFVFDDTRRVSPEYKLLRGFKKIDLRSGKPTG